MAYINPSPADEAAADAVRIYQTDSERWGYLTNYIRVFALQPAVYDAWLQLIGTVRSGMDPRRYELATLAAARRRRSTYCSVAHAQQLRDRFYDSAIVHRIATDHHDAGLDPVDVAIMDFAEKAAGDPADITQDDVDALRAYGLSDQEIFQVVLAAAARAFFTTVVEAVGLQADFQFRASLDPDLRKVLSVGRPVAPEPPQAGN
jgi:uncharacterized peroxidase-related enzyme